MYQTEQHIISTKNNYILVQYNTSNRNNMKQYSLHNTANHLGFRLPECGALFSGSDLDFSYKKEIDYESIL